MRRKIILVVFVFALCLIAGNIHAGTICINEAEWCNDLKMTYSDQEGQIIEMYGYEYGCGYNDRLYSGSVHIVGNIAYIGLTGVINTTAPNPKLAVKFYQLNLGTMTGTGTWSYNDGGYWNGTSTVTGVSCSPTTPESVDLNTPDSSAR